MTEEEKKKLLEKFMTPIEPESNDDEAIENDWTDEEIIAAVRKQLKKLGIEL